mmetsp:Transcript_51745/g.130851  ORF Transcript_51745/g.130851 Transcript_51745/m.130851 type:complete len:272 (-) Transcript_51745:25-840(-)
MRPQAWPTQTRRLQSQRPLQRWMPSASGAGKAAQGRRRCRYRPKPCRHRRGSAVAAARPPRRPRHRQRVCRGRGRPHAPRRSAGPTSPRRAPSRRREQRSAVRSSVTAPRAPATAPPGRTKRRRRRAGGRRQRVRGLQHPRPGSPYHRRRVHATASPPHPWRPGPARRRLGRRAACRRGRAPRASDSARARCSAHMQCRRRSACRRGPASASSGSPPTPGPTARPLGRSRGFFEDEQSSRFAGRAPPRTRPAATTSRGVGRGRRRNEDRRT